jgi:hypothetical protein
MDWAHKTRTGDEDAGVSTVAMADRLARSVLDLTVGSDVSLLTYMSVGVGECEATKVVMCCDGESMFRIVGRPGRSVGEMDGGLVMGNVGS